MKDHLRPRDFVALIHLRAINSTGSPLPLDAYRWVYDAIKSDLWLASVSGGTDIASGFVACSPTLPVNAGEIQCRKLGVSAFAFNDAGNAVIEEVGELVITKPMPSMPLFFWNDQEHKRYRESYFETFPGVWRQGDWIRFTARGTAVIYGRSDSTINRLKSCIAQQIRSKASARHIPNEVYEVAEIPRTLTGKKMEVPVRKLLLGMARDKVASADSMANPASLDFFIALAAQLNTTDA